MSIFISIFKSCYDLKYNLYNIKAILFDSRESYFKLDNENAIVKLYYKNYFHWIKNQQKLLVTTSIVSAINIHKYTADFLLNKMVFIIYNLTMAFSLPNLKYDSRESNNIPFII